MRTFVRVVDAGSFAAAARELDLNQAVVTRLVADLEQHLGARLLQRTTRSMHLTDAGNAYLAHCRTILAEVEAAETVVRNGQEKPAGRVRVALPLLFGTDVLPKRLPEMRRRFPDIVLDVTLLDRPLDLINEGFDLAVVTSLNPPAGGASIISRPLFEMAFSLCAAPAYLAAHGEPTKPAELSHHACIGVYHSVQGDQWMLRSGQREQRVPVNVVLWAGDMRLMRESVRTGVGIGVMSQRAILADEQAGLLKAILPQWQIGAVGFSVVYPSRQFIPARVRAVVDFIVEETRNVPFPPKSLSKRN
jgi:DNA-binding transcriptional LysR family regulator